MDLISAVLGFIVGIGGLILGGIVILFVIVWIMATSDPNEMEAKKYGLDTWTPHDPSIHGADMAHTDQQGSFGGEMDSIGCFFNWNVSDHPAWFADKHNLISFLEEDYLYLTEKYSSINQDRAYGEAVESEYQKIVCDGLLELEKQDDATWGISDILAIVEAFSKDDGFVWFTFEDVCYGKADSWSYRERFRWNGQRDIEQDIDDSPILDGELDAFKEYMSSVWQS